MSYINPSQKIFQHLDRLHAIKVGGKPPPVNVEIDLSNRCSHGCSWCHFAYTHTRGPLVGKMHKPDGAIDGGDLMNTLFAIDTLDQLKQADVKSVTWTGGGEPTLHPDFNSIICYAFNIGLEQGLYTHGGHIDQTRAMFLKEKCTWVYVSLDECDAESFKVSKGVNRFDAVLQGIRALVAAEGSATIGLGFLLHRGNYSRVHDMVRLGRTLGVDYVQFRPTVQFSMERPGEVAEDTTWVTWAIKYLRTYEGDDFVTADISRFQRYALWQGHGYATCNWSALQTVITPNGKVWRCTNKREMPDALLGDLSVESFADLWARSGGPCAVNSQCRVACKGDPGNQTLERIFAPAAHGNFI
jgi:MoaA/NifB/PqqE/SkfB family radical SAM enzyme